MGHGLARPIRGLDDPQPPHPGNRPRPMITGQPQRGLLFRRSTESVPPSAPESVSAG
jgi:hypothetical protein